MYLDKVKSNVGEIIDKYCSLEKDFDIILFIEAKHDISHLYLSLSFLQSGMLRGEFDSVVLQPSIAMIKEIEGIINDLGKKHSVNIYVYCPTSCALHFL